MPALPPPSPPGQSYTRWPCFYGWVLVAVAFITMGIGVNARTAFSLLFPPLVAEFGWTRGVTAGAFSAGFLVATLFAPCIGMLMDRVGPRVVLPLGVVLVGSGLGLASWVRQPWHLYLTFGVLVVGGSVCISYIGHALFCRSGLCANTVWPWGSRSPASDSAPSCCSPGYNASLVRQDGGRRAWCWPCCSSWRCCPSTSFFPDAGLRISGSRPTGIHHRRGPVWHRQDRRPSWTRRGPRPTGPWGKLSRRRAFGSWVLPTLAGSIAGMRCRSTRPSTSWISACHPSRPPRP